MQITIAHNPVAPHAPPDEQDVMAQVAAVSGALDERGHTVATLACTLDLEAAREELVRWRPDLVFNLVESLDGTCRLLPLFPALLDRLGLPYTGTGAFALWATTHKLIAKRCLQAGGIDSPPWVGPVPDEPLCPPVGPARQFVWPQRWIVKSLWEHASLGLDEGCLVSNADRPTLLARMEERLDALGGGCFAEAYVEGREFNLSLLQGDDGPQVLPPAEIVFEDYPEGMIPIVGYRAKWETETFEYNHTPRRFRFHRKDRPLLSDLCDTARRCWRLFGLRGYARVDFRVDRQGRPWVLEVNANPCLSPDAGFAAALAETRIPFPAAVERILAGCIRSSVPGRAGGKAGRQTGVCGPALHFAIGREG